METEKLEALIGRYIDGTASAQERKCLDEWYTSFDSQEDLYMPFSVQERASVAKKFSELMVDLSNCQTRPVF